MKEVTEPRGEIVRLLQEQLDTLEQITVVRLTDAEWKEYDKRQERIRELQAQLDQLRSAA